MYVCMYVCSMHACIHACMYTHIYVIYTLYVSLLATVVWREVIIIFLVTFHKLNFRPCSAAIRPKVICADLDESSIMQISKGAG